KLDLPSEPLLVRCDFSLMQHALANLLMNAVTHTPQTTSIDLQLRIEDGAVVLEVADRGPGIPGEVMPRIFEKFFRAPNAPTGGSGLGLTIAKGFIQAMGGTIAVGNRPGGGAIFSLRLPEMQTASTSPVAK